MSRFSTGTANVSGNRTLAGKVFLAGLAVLAGGAIYIFLRSGEPLFFRWAEYFGLEGLLLRLRDAGGLSGTDLPAWFRYSLPDGLWAFAYALLIASIWSTSHSPLRKIWIASIPVLVLGFEFGQLAGLIPGTFCLTDLLFCTSGLVLGIIMGNRNPKNSRNEPFSS